MNKLITVLACVLTCSPVALAQATNEALVVDSRSGKPVTQVQVSIYGPVSKKILLGQDARYILSALPKGTYTLTFSAHGYETKQIEVVKREEGSIAIPTLQLVALREGLASRYDDLIVSDEGDSESAGVQDRVTLLTSSRDPFLSASSYVFSTARFRNRGYDSPYGEQMLNGIGMNDLNSGYSAWALWGGLNDVTRLQQTSQTFEPISSGFGSVGITNNVTTRPSLYGAQHRLTYSNSNRTYSNRFAYTYTSGERKDGWSFAASVMRRIGSGQYSYVRGQHYDAWSYFMGIEKKFDPMNSISLVALGAPTRRGVASASTQEVYDLVGSNFYNPNIGRQGGKWRNARERKNHEPIIQLSHYYNNVAKQLYINTTFSYRFGQNTYSALNWYNAPDPRADYYRYLPSYFTRMVKTKPRPIAIQSYGRPSLMYDTSTGIVFMRRTEEI